MTTKTVGEDLPISFTYQFHTYVLPAEEFVMRYLDLPRFQGYCSACNRFGKQWVCPPFDYDERALLTSREYIHLIGMQVFPSPESRALPTDALSLKRVSYRIMRDARMIVDPKLLSLERIYPDSLALFAGSCYVCAGGLCTRPNKPCIHPKKARPSLEALGADLSGAATELFGIPMLWAEGYRLQPYFFYISGLLSPSGERIPSSHFDTKQR